MSIAGVSLCMIVKDEGHILGQALASVCPLVDEMIVVDTGSKDDSAEIAANYGAKVHTFQWTGDFSEARNFSLSKATKPWILVLDADEAIDESQFQEFQELLRGNAPGYFLTQRHYVERFDIAEFTPCKGEFPLWERQYPGYSESRLVRLFRHTTEIFYEGRVHELVEHSLRRGPRGPAAPSKILLHHYGQTIELIARKGKRTLYRNLGEEKLGEQLEDWSSNFELGLEYLHSNDASRAAECLIRALSLDPSQTRVHLNLAPVLFRLGRPQDGLEVLADAIHRAGENPDIYHNIGTIYLQLGKLELAAAAFSRAISLRPRFVAATLNLAITFECLRKIPEARLCYEQLCRLVPSNTRFADRLAALQ